MFKKILVPIDGSDTSLHVLKEAQDLAQDLGARLTILTVIPDLVLIEHMPNDFATQDIIQASQERATHVIEKAKEVIHYQGPVDYVSIHGQPAKAIVNYAQEKGLDLIMIGNRGLGAFSRSLLGSVSNRVINLSDIPVLVVKDPKAE